MKRKILFIAYLLLCYFVLNSCIKRVNNDLPQIEIDSPYSFQGISISDSIEFNVRISNIGKESLEIDFLNVGCGCLADFYFDFKKLNSGDVDSIVFKYKPSKIGYIEENIFIYFIGYKNPIHLLIKGRVSARNENLHVVSIDDAPKEDFINFSSFFQYN